MSSASGGLLAMVMAIGGLRSPYKVFQNNSVENICEPLGDLSSF